MPDFRPPFWLVWCEDGGPPTVKHVTYARAKAEAQRLARAHPGEHFVVMAAATGFRKHDLDETRFSDHAPDFDDDLQIPF